jgi:adenine-specific DNA-methyltransferase
MDEIFGRRNFIANIIWQKVYSPKNSAKYFSAMHDHILVYAKDKDLWRRNLLPREEKQDQAYKNPDNDPRGPWKPADLSGRNYYSLGTYPITTPSGRVIPGPPRGRYWTVSPAAFEEMVANNEIWWGADGDAIPQSKTFLRDVQQGLVPQTIWFYREVGHTQDAKREIKDLFPDEQAVFATAKPERLLKRIVEIGSREGDLVLDCFLGSGTTAAVAHKMNRRWIGIEAGEHADTLCLARMKKVVDGSDLGGISPLVPPHPSRTPDQKDVFGEPVIPLGWTGGGGFRFSTVGPPLVEQDPELGVWRLNYDNGRLIEAVCLQEGFNICVDGTRHGVKGRHYAHITEQFVTQELVDALATELDDGEAFSVYCLKSARGLKLPDEIEIKRIPQALLEGP